MGRLNGVWIEPDRTVRIKPEVCGKECWTRDNKGNAITVRVERVVVEIPSGELSYWVRPEPAMLPEQNNRVLAVSGDKFLTLELYDSKEALCQAIEDMKSESPGSENEAADTGNPTNRG